METIYEEGVIFKSIRQRSFRIKADGTETISTFGAFKINSLGNRISDVRYYNKESFEIEIQLTDKQKKIKESLFKISKNILSIARSLEKMNDSDIECSLGGNIALIKLQIKKLEH